jgi:hypothetical protein
MDMLAQKILSERNDMETEAMVTKREGKLDEIQACCLCDRLLKNPSEWIRSRNRVICVSCYESLLNPFPKCCAGSAAV